MFNQLENGLISEGKTELADAVKALHKLHGVDIPTSREIHKIIRFSSKDRIVLEKQGYVIIELLGNSLADLRNDKLPVYVLGFERFESHPFERQSSMCTQVAVNPKDFFLSDSGNKTLEEQKAMIHAYSDNVRMSIPGVVAVMGSVSDYAELSFAYCSKTGEQLFSKPGIRSASYVMPDHSQTAWLYSPEDRVDVYVQNIVCDAESPNLWAAPLVVPSQAVS
jgi:hypothetical protein